MEISIDEYVALVRGDYFLKPCCDCYQGVVYIDGQIGEQVSPHEFQTLNDNENLEEDIDYYQEECGECFGIGKIVMFE